MGHPPAPLAYTVDGPDDAPVLLLGSSLGTTGAIWRLQVPELATSLRVIRFDHRGHGGSPLLPGPYTMDDLGGDVVALLDHLGIARAHYAGLSMGGMVGQWFAAHAPQRVDRLVLVSTTAYLPPAQAWHDRAAAVRAGGMTAVADAVLSRWFTPAFGVPDWVRAEFLACSPAGYAACCEAIATMDLRPALSTITAPTLVISATEDPSTPPEHGRALATGIPGARLELVESAAHAANVERPDVVTRLLLQHLA